MSQEARGDIGDIFDVVIPVEFDFLGHTIRLHVYTAGWSRLRKEDRDLIRTTDEAANAIEGEIQSGDGGLTTAGYDRAVTRARGQLPMMLAAWECDGLPMKRGDKLFPPTVENIANTPDALLLLAYTQACKVWQEGPTNGGGSPTGSQPEERPEQNQTETTSPLST